MAIQAVVSTGDNVDRPTTGSFVYQVYISADIGQVSVWNGSSWDEYTMEGGSSGVTDHGALTGLADDDHTQYQLRSEKGATSGYAELDGGGTVPDAQIPSGIARDSEVSSAISTHEGLSDPHTGYRLESDGVDITELDTVETDTALRLAPDGAGGVEWSTGGGGGGSGDVTYAVLQAAQLVNEVMNFPSREKADNTQPQWWNEADANATLTEVDVVGESITETYGRALKVVVATSNSHAYQRFTYADQPRVKSGQKLSAIFAVWSVSSVAARIRLQSSVGSLGVSSDATAAGWTILTVENVTLDGTYVDIRLEVDVGTAYFVPLGLNIGAKAIPLKPRGTRKITQDPQTAVANQAGAADPETWEDADLTSVTSPLAVHAYLRGYLWETTSTTEYRWYIRIKGGSASNNDASLVIAKYASGDPIENSVFEIGLDSEQTFQHYLDRFSGSSTLNGGGMYCYGYDEWE